LFSLPLLLLSFYDLDFYDFITMMFVCIARCYVFLSFTCLTRDSVGKMRDFNGESNFNNFVATNDERRFFTQHRYPVSFFIEKNFCVCWENER